MPNFWGLYGMPQREFSREQFIEYHRVTQPTWTLVMNDVQLARDTKAASPDTNVIVRLYKDDGFWYTQKPEDYLNFMDDNHVDENLWCFVDNEAGISPDWHLRLIAANLKRATPRKLVIGNLSVGTPARSGWRIEDVWIEAKALLVALDLYRDWLVFGLHEYFNCVPTSGFIGGWPDNAGVSPGVPGGRDLVTFTNWPGRAEAQTLTKFHCGRFEFLNRACKELGIPAPRIVLTEHGQDDVSDIKAWVEKTVGQGIRGFRTLESWMQKRFGWTLERGYYEMLSYLRQNVYTGTNVEGAVLYTFGNNGDSQWLPFNTKGSGLVERIQANNIAPAQRLPDFPPDFDQRCEVAQLASLSPRLIVRSQPSMSSDRLATITSEGMPGKYLPATALKTAEQVYETITGVGGMWIPVEVSGQRGWVFGGYLQAKALDELPEPEIPPIDLASAYNLAWNIKLQAEQLLRILSEGKVS